jgi:FlaA1/EpsC-like NDP-sugar epimerase
MAAVPRRAKRLIMLMADAVAMPVAAGVSLWLVDQESELWNEPLFWFATLAICLLTFQLRGLYRSIVHFMGLELIQNAYESVTIAATGLFLVALWIIEPVTALKFSIAFWLLALTYMAGSRFAVRLLLRERNGKGDRVLIYGAGDAGVHLASALSERAEFTPAGFVDDNVSLHGTVINGHEVNSPAHLPELIETLDISKVLLALPSATRRRRRQILSRLEGLTVHVQTMPDIADLVAGHASVDEIREVDVADLLGRDAVPPLPELLHACIRGRSVMVTGAGGSIGAELCRQICHLSPSKLILLESSEAALYAVNRAISEIVDRDRLEVVPVLASAHHRQRVQGVCETFGVQTIYHAAAYKHVPLVEHNMIEGIHNNVFGTLHTAEAAMAAGVQSFVLISTDKAVQPTNIMGATKRLAELTLQALSQECSDTVFSMVRFGNVLESSGSVVPLFRDQIRNGGPVTVTHPNIYRYFMTIPEAAELVIQAGSMARGGDVFVLDMGKSVRIADLAEKMIHLMGLSVRDEDHPDGDIEIVYTGLRPAEKLYEELLIGNNVCGTDHSMIMRAVEDYLPWSELRGLLDELWSACLQLDCERGRELLLCAVGEYEPSIGLVDYVWIESQRPAAATDQPSKVTELRPGVGGVTGSAS